jgi:hypothetical protein
MERSTHHLGERVSARFRALDRRLHIDHRGRSEWIWAVPILTFAGTFVLVAVVGAVTAGVTPALYVPIGLIMALASSGMSIAYMTPEPDAPGDEGGDDGGQHAREPAPPPTRPSHGRAWWERAWRDTELPDEPRPRREEPTAPR